ncbi:MULTISPECIES: hypothetical protein [unclassified Pseudoalteromonas]|uniref:hypothetical protein n=1 Tax=unclassified Pseudoalteromonas TaxID=194690 RepID=UPI0015F80E7C|nr:MULTISPECIES: hypothetical protein [unclassified Pseudoalteromonas]MBB1290989.1 hypothetical protein [Pseudoalteromonas sp. SR41-5]MBB1415309.1 hypothetical protein [Pseudoalteromonas sp. SG43-8]
MIFLISDTKRKELKNVVFEDIKADVSSKDQAWEVNTFLIRYFSTEKAAVFWCSERGISTTIGVKHKGLDITPSDKILKPYQVGENDIVLAYNEQRAKHVLSNSTGVDIEEFEEVKDLSNDLDMGFCNEEGEFIHTLKTLIENSDGQGERYLTGWE